MTTPPARLQEIQDKALEAEMSQFLTNIWRRLTFRKIKKEGWQAYKETFRKLWKEAHQ